MSCQVVDARELTSSSRTPEMMSTRSGCRENGLSRLYAGIHFRHAVRDDAVSATAPAGRWPKLSNRFGEPPSTGSEPLRHPCVVVAE
jgi:hypothetical protein